MFRARRSRRLAAMEENPAFTVSLLHAFLKVKAS